ncbi:MAG: DUF721 domain-containing protein [Treponema sp.]|nr:DUF721 domain-containing protein [Treponema sp.]
MKRAGDVFSALFDGEMARKADGYSAFMSCWKDLMEKNHIAAAAAHSRIQKLDKGLVWIEADHPGWKQILQTKESKLLHDFRYRFPELDISGLAIVLSRPGPAPEPSAAHTAGGEIPAENDNLKSALPHEQPQAGCGYEAIKDPALRDVLMRLEQRIADRESGSQ